MFTLALLHTINLTSANAQHIHTSIHTHVLATLHATIARNQGSNQYTLLLKQINSYSYSLQDKAWIHKSEARENEGTQEQRKLKSSPLKTKQMAKT